MDSFTHLVAGALTPLAFRGTPKRAAVVCFGIIAGELPDIDIFFGAGAEALLTLHRGITHSLFVQPFMALLVTLPFYLWLRRRTPLPTQRAGLAGFGFTRMGLIAFAALLLHIYLDCMTTFGTQILLPFSDVRVGLPAMFIVDPLLTLPALGFLLYALRLKAETPPAPPGPAFGAPFSSRSRKTARIALAWLLLYPLACLAINAAATAWLTPSLTASVRNAEAQNGQPAGRSACPASLRLLPEPFSPFLWKAVVEDGDTLHMGAVALWAADKAELDPYAKPDRRLYAALRRQHRLFVFFDAFAPLMVQTERPAPAGIQAHYKDPIKEYAFMDLRYVIAPGSPARLAGRGDPNFVLEARVNNKNDRGELLEFRFLHRGNDAEKTAWEETAGVRAAPQ